MDGTLLTIVALVPALVFSIVFHEVAHGWTALALGDPTAKERRRLSLNPIRHVDPFGTLILRQWISGIPNELIDAARLDGAGELRIIASIIAPLSAPPLGALAVFTFLISWDDYLFPSIVLTDPNTRTLPLALAGLKSLFWERYELFCAGAGQRGQLGSDFLGWTPAKLDVPCD